MNIKTIAVSLVTAQEAEWLMPLACDLARAHGAHLTAVHPAEPYVPYVGVGEGVAALPAPGFLDWQEEETQAIRAIFDRHAGAEDFPSEWRAQDVSVQGSDAYLVDSVRAADIVVTALTEPETRRSEQHRLQEHLIRNSGRPVLALPKGADVSTLGERIAIGWSRTREAARAAHDALAFAAPGARIDVVHIGRDGDMEEGTRDDLAAAIDRHGFRTEVIERDAGVGETGEALLRVAFETGATLVATGAFGHSRAYDFVIGAVTRYLLDNAKVPVLLSK